MAVRFVGAVVTQGAHGCTVYRNGMTPIYVPSRQTRVVDTTGAGDAFISGFLSSWLSQPIPNDSDLEHKDWACSIYGQAGTNLKPLGRCESTLLGEVRAVREAAKDVLLRWCITVKART
eukprot:Skav214617  [mRNA]  locus=scaffold961:21493:35263:- [translate_table: standard]